MPECSDCGSTQGVVVWDARDEKYRHFGACFWAPSPMAEVPC